jgi:ABC-type uncharacterized transport system substrate-binding protein
MRRQLSALARFLLGILTATKLEIVIDLEAAKQIGLTVPVRVLGRANQVIK